MKHKIEQTLSRFSTVKHKDEKGQTLPKTSHLLINKAFEGVGGN